MYVSKVRKMIKRIISVSVVMVVLCLVFALIAPTAAQDTIAGSRTISDTTVAPGDTFTVTVEVDITGMVYGPVLDEDVPEGWTVTVVNNDGGTPGLGTSWLWGGEQATDKTVVYEVTVPSDVAEGDYPVTGTVLATAAGETIGPFTITGDNSVTVSVDHTQTPSPTLISEVIPTPSLTPVITPTPTPSPSPSPSPGPSPAVTPFPSPSPSSISTPTLTSPPTELGFEAILAIAGLLAVAYIALRRKK